MLQRVSVFCGVRAPCSAVLFLSTRHELGAFVGALAEMHSVVRRVSAACGAGALFVSHLVRIAQAEEMGT